MRIRLQIEQQALPPCESEWQHQTEGKQHKLEANLEQPVRRQCRCHLTDPPAPDTSFPAQEEQAPALHEYGRSIPISSALSRMYTSSGHPNSFSPIGVISFTLVLSHRYHSPATPTALHPEQSLTHLWKWPQAHRRRRLRPLEEGSRRNWAGECGGAAHFLFVFWLVVRWMRWNGMRGCGMFFKEDFGCGCGLTPYLLSNEW